MRRRPTFAPLIEIRRPAARSSWRERARSSPPAAAGRPETPTANAVPTASDGRPPARLRWPRPPPPWRRPPPRTPGTRAPLRAIGLAPPLAPLGCSRRSDTAGRSMRGTGKGTPGGSRTDTIAPPPGPPAKAPAPGRGFAKDPPAEPAAPRTRGSRTRRRRGRPGLGAPSHPPAANQLGETLEPAIPRPFDVVGETTRGQLPGGQMIAEAFAAKPFARTWLVGTVARAYVSSLMAFHREFLRRDHIMGQRSATTARPIAPRRAYGLRTSSR